MKTSIATVCLSGSLAEKLGAIAQAGFDGIELFELDLVGSALKPEAVASRVRDLGLTIDLYQPFRDAEGLPPEAFDRALRRAAHKFDLMNRLGTPTMLVCSNATPDAIDDDSLVADQLGRLADLARTFDVRVAYEALAWGRHVSTLEHSWRIVQTVDHPSLGICLDSFHILARGGDLGLISRIPGGKIFFCQLADAQGSALDILSWSRHHRLFPGEGDWDLPTFVAALDASGYDGPLSLEVFNDVFRESDPVETARAARRSLRLLEDAAARRGANPGSLRALPDAPTPHNVSFVELAAGPGGELADLLQTLGFRFEGRHRRKDAELWTCHNIRIVINRDLGAQVARITGIGVETADLDLTARRLAAMPVRTLARDEAPGEQHFLVVPAPDGTEFCFAPTTDGTPEWTAEFEATGRSAPTSSSPAGLAGVDHVALAQPWDRADESALFYTGILSLTGTPPVDVASHSGLLRSRSYADDARTIRIVTNVRPTNATAQSHPNHIAFSTDDIFATLAALRERGATTAGIPGNYYEDAAARLELDDEYLSRLTEENLLIDRDDHGTFLHAYLQPVGELLVEVVQRCDGYDGYGATNATVRLSAMRTGRAR
jgi:4-hydroxyphenylpyruvate dioxygenase and related hemolysins